MAEKVIVVLVDGMRPDGMMGCGHPYAAELLAKSTYALNAQTVFPSVTLPCHMSLFHSVDPARHGIMTNLYTPQVRPVVGLVDQLDKYDKKCAFFYTWEELRDLTRPDHLHTALCLNQHKMADTDRKITRAAIRYIQEEAPDFLFLYLGETDERGGHDVGWMSDTYMRVVHNAMDCVKELQEAIPEDYTLILLADHGGHERSHGADIPEDMTIPLVFCGPKFDKGKVLDAASIKDVAPTVAHLLGVPPVREWEGSVLA